MFSKDVLKRLIKTNQDLVLRSKSSFFERKQVNKLFEYKGGNALILKGIRRSGKSTLLKLFITEKFADKYYYINFEDERLSNFKVTDFQTLVEAFNELFGYSNYLFFDEIQNVLGWEKFVNRLLEEGNHVFITGSNSDLLSRELGTHMTGRHTDLEIFPMSFKEVLEFKNFKISPDNIYTLSEQAELNNRFAEYLSKGGMPEAIIKEDPESLQSIVSDIIQKDIIKRYNVRKPNELKTILQFLVSNIGNRVTFKSLANNYKLSSISTVKNYIQYAEDTYLIFTVVKFEKKIKQFDKNPKKIYCMDNGISVQNSISLEEQKGSLLENAIAIELKRRGKEIYYYASRNGKEVDFVVVQNNGLEKKVLSAIQVAYEISNPSTRKREEEALLAALEEQKIESGTIITMDHEETKQANQKTINYIPAWKWLLEKTS